jgi:hypothetical protein
VRRTLSPKQPSSTTKDHNSFQSCAAAAIAKWLSIPQGWQRAGGLATLFDTAASTVRTDLAVPEHLYSPAYADRAKTVNHRTYLTISPLSLRLGVPINNDFEEGQETQLASAIIANDAGIT